MSDAPTKTGFPTGDFISENAVRTVFGRRRPASRSTTGLTENGLPAHSSAAREDTVGPAGGARRLRRWSVVELIALEFAHTNPLLFSDFFHS